MKLRGKNEVDSSHDELSDQQIAKQIRRIKNETVDKAEWWGELYTDLLTAMLDSDMTRNQMKERSKWAAELCDLALGELEERWG